MIKYVSLVKWCVAHMNITGRVEGVRVAWVNHIFHDTHPFGNVIAQVIYERPFSLIYNKRIKNLSRY